MTITSDPFPPFVQGRPGAAETNRTSRSTARASSSTRRAATRSAITGTLTGVNGAERGLIPFQVANCDGLPFAPKLTASADASSETSTAPPSRSSSNRRGSDRRTSRKVDLQLPIALPARLTTLQKACPAASFECESGGLQPKLGDRHRDDPHTRAKNPLSGPAYLVSHGGAAFPDVEFVLQGEGITLLLDGKTDIKKGITYSRFESAPGRSVHEASKRSCRPARTRRSPPTSVERNSTSAATPCRCRPKSPRRTAPS